MAEFRTIKMSFWSDPFIEELLPAEKLVYLYLFTSPYTNTLGVCQVTLRKIAYETGLNLQEVTDAIAKFAGMKKLVIDGTSILIAKFIKNQCSSSNNVVTYLKREFQNLDSVKLRDALCLLYPHLFSELHTISDNTDTIWEPYPDHIDMAGGIKVQGTLVDGNGYRVQGTAEKPAAPLPPQYAEYATEFQNAVCAEQPGIALQVTDALIRSGAAELEKAVRLDGLDFEEIKAALDWARQDSFWAPNVLSLAQIRKKKDKNSPNKIQRIVAQYRKSKQPQRVATRQTESRYERDQREMRESYQETMRILGMLDGKGTDNEQERADFINAGTV